MSMLTRPDSGKRIVAVVIDILLSTGLAGLIWMVVSIISGYLGFLFGWLGAGIFFLYRDALPFRDLEGTSPGKRLFGLHTVGEGNKPCDGQSSLKRNLTLSFPFFAIALGGALPRIGFLFGLAGLIFAMLFYLMEVLKVLFDDRGLRLGDLLANTKIVEFHNRPQITDEPNI